MDSHKTRVSPTPQHQNQQETPCFAALNLLWFESLEKQGCQEHVLSLPPTWPPAICVPTQGAARARLEEKGSHFTSLSPKHSPARHQPSQLKSTWLRAACLRPVNHGFHCPAPRWQTPAAAAQLPPAQGSPQAQSGASDSTMTQTPTTKSKQTFYAPNTQSLRRRRARAG